MRIATATTTVIALTLAAGIAAPAASATGTDHTTDGLWRGDHRS